MEQTLQRSQEIVEQAIRDYKPYAIVCMFSGGKDSMLAYQVARTLGVKVTHILHGITGTGIKETTDFARQFGMTQEPTWIEANAGKAYEEYVLRKGFFGKGVDAHKFAYHILKHQRFISAISHHIRHKKRGRNVLFVNGARVDESVNRSKNLTEPITADRHTKSNVWVNICHYWTQPERDVFLDDCKAPCNPVTKNLCRSGECMCGTMQSEGDRFEASYYYPDWGRWLNDLEARVRQDHGWGWGEAMPKRCQTNSEQIPLFSDFQPMCVSCKNIYEVAQLNQNSNERRSQPAADG